MNFGASAAQLVDAEPVNPCTSTTGRGCSGVGTHCQSFTAAGSFAFSEGSSGGFGGCAGGCVDWTDSALPTVAGPATEGEPTAISASDATATITLRTRILGNRILASLRCLRPPPGY